MNDINAPQQIWTFTRSVPISLQCVGLLSLIFHHVGFVKTLRL